MAPYQPFAFSTRTAAAATALALLLAQSSSACVWLMGQARDRVHGSPSGTSWNYAFRGDDWEGADAKGNSWVCLSGKTQSPINLVADDAYEGPGKYKTSWTYSPLTSNGSDIAVYNNGHTIQVQWTGQLQSTVLAYANNTIVDVVRGADGKAQHGGLRQVQLTPLQFHFHTASEHTVDGTFAPLEMHIVHSVPQSVLPGCPASGCLSVVGVMLHISDNLDDGNDALDVIFSHMPEREGVMEYLPAGAVLDIDALLPPQDDRGYLQYEGSLTTPPCTEGLLWHVLKTPVYISKAQYLAYSRAVGLKNCTSTSSTTTTTTGGPYRRSLHADHDHHHHHDHSFDELLSSLESFQRGSYSGFVNGAALRNAASLGGSKKRMSRALLGGAATDGGNYTCKIAAYGWTNRNVQYVNDRTVYSYC